MRRTSGIVAIWRRAAVALGVLGLFLPALPAQASVTDLGEQLGKLLTQVPKPPGATGQDSERKLVLNGQKLHLVTGHTVRPVRETLEFYRVKFEDQAKAPKLGLKTLGVHQATDQSGFLLMIDPQSREAMMGLVEQETQLLSAGPLHMVTAVQRGSGTDYLVAWTDRPLNVEALSPSGENDVAGSDLPQVPRPVGAVRGLNIFEPSAGYGLVSYRFPGAADSSLRIAKESLLAAGFHEDPDSQVVAEQSASPVVQLHRQRNSIILKSRNRRTTGSEVMYLWRAQ